MSKDMIYEPRGRALEYSPLACNLFTGCVHCCRYCYGPSSLHKARKEYEAGIQMKADVLERFEKSAEKYYNDPREILFSFFTDAYQTEESAEIMRKALEIGEANNLNIQILTKNGERASEDFDILKRNNWKFGSTIIFMDEKLREEWEPGAPSIASRVRAVKKAHDMGIYTWVSIEPVVDADSALAVMDELKGYVDLWKVGKLNHNKDIEDKIDWKQFLKDSIEKLNYERTVFKKDLVAFITK